MLDDCFVYLILLSLSTQRDVLYKKSQGFILKEIYVQRFKACWLLYVSVRFILKKIDVLFFTVLTPFLNECQKKQGLCSNAVLNYFLLY